MLYVVMLCCNVMFVRLYGAASDIIRRISITANTVIDF